MSKMKHIIALIIVLTVIAAIVVALPKIFGTEVVPTKKTVQEETAVDSTAKKTEDIPKDTASFETKFKEHMEIIQETKRRSKTYWTLGRGKTIIVYLLQAQRFIQDNGGQVISMEELHDNKVFQSARLELLKPSGDTLKLELQVSDNIFRSDASVLSIAFQVTTLTPELIEALNQLDFPFNLLVMPFGMSETFYPDLDKVKNKEVTLWLTMESSKLNKSHNKYRPLRIHHTEDQIETVVSDAKKLIPNAQGMVTKFGEQAVEHKQLLQAILRPAEKNKLWFLDITGNKQSKIMDACKDFKIKCKIAAAYNPENSSLEDYVMQKHREAIKSGLAAMILPLNMETIGYVSELSKKFEKQGTTVVNLSTFISY